MPDSASIQKLKGGLRGDVVLPGDTGYDDLRKVWNGMIDRHPALIVRAAGVADVIDCVNFARTQHLLLAVRGGGHNVAGNGVCEGGILIDLSRMKSVRVDPIGRVARAEAGAIWRDFDRETQAFGLATTGGQISTTGVSGLTLGGGWGYLSRQYGLASDNLLSVDLVTADGQFRTVGPTENPDLFWALRGGGGNFGIVTSLEYQLHPVGPVYAGLLAYPLQNAKEVLQIYREFARTAPDQMGSGIVLNALPEGLPVAGVIICYNGPPAEGERLVHPFRTFGPPVMDQVGPIPYTAAQQLVDGLYPSGRLHYWKSTFLKEISDAAIDTMIAYCAKRPTPFSHVVIEGTLGGAVRRTDPGLTAFAHRDAMFSFSVLGVTTDSTEVAHCASWTREFWRAMEPYSSGGVYVNYLGDAADEGLERIRSAYGPEKYARLVVTKNKWDPTNLFRVNQNILPAP
jgi:FAD binding domain/Berberine and berberine like